MALIVWPVSTSMLKVSASSPAISAETDPA
jgi:hypothetical protein